MAASSLHRSQTQRYCALSFSPWEQNFVIIYLPEPPGEKVGYQLVWLTLRSDERSGVPLYMRDKIMRLLTCVLLYPVLCWLYFLCTMLRAAQILRAYFMLSDKLFTHAAIHPVSLMHRKSELTSCHPVSLEEQSRPKEMHYYVGPVPHGDRPHCTNSLIRFCFFVLQLMNYPSIHPKQRRSGHWRQRRRHRQWWRR